jgi:DNA gyrase inhibitor GyrI
MNKSNSGFIVQFTMPKSYTTSTLPIPDDPRVEIRQIPSRTVAVFTYSGSWSESRYQSKLDEFQNELKKNSVKTMGQPVLARYNSPFQLWFLRRNEIWIEVIE